MSNDNNPIERGQLSYADVRFRFWPDGLKPPESACLAVIVEKTTYFGKESDWIDIVQFEKYTSLSRATIFRALNVLEQAGLIRRENGRGSRRLFAHDVTCFIEDSTAKLRRARSHCATESQSETSQSETVESQSETVESQSETAESQSETQQKIRQKIRQKTKQKKGAKDESKVVYPSWLNLEIWEKYRAARKEIRKPMTPTVEEMAIKNLDKFRLQGYDPNEIVATSAGNGWQGLFPPKGGATQKRQSSFARAMEHNMRVLEEINRECEADDGEE